MWSLFPCSDEIQAFKGNTQQNTTIPWNNGNTVQFFDPHKMHRNPKKCAPGKIRTRWSNRNHRFNPIKTNRYNTMDTKIADMNKIDVIKPTPRRACEHFSLSWSYCKQNASHPSPIHSDWSGKDWEGDKAKAYIYDWSVIVFLLFWYLSICTILYMFMHHG